MAKKATTKTAKKATAKKAATKSTKKTAKKTTKKVASKKAVKKVTKKAAKKITAESQELELVAKIAPSYDELQQAAYFNYMERLKNGRPGTPELDWSKAQQDLT